MITHKILVDDPTVTVRLEIRGAPNTPNNGIQTMTLDLDSLTELLRDLPTIINTANAVHRALNEPPEEIPF